MQSELARIPRDRDYGDVTPVKGIALGGGRHTVEVAVRVKLVEG